MIVLYALLLTAVGAAVPVYKDPRAPVVERVADLLPRLTLEEKIAQLYAVHQSAPVLRQHLKTGAGSAKYGDCVSCTIISDCIEQRNNLQREFLNTSRLGIPLIFINEGLHGGAPYGTVFPMPISQGASWNVSLVAAIADAIADQASTIGVQVVFAPVVNMMTDPRFGRLQEGFGEEPTHTAHMGRASVVALQGGVGNTSTYFDTTRHVAALAKHFAAYGAASGGLNAAPAQVTNRTLHDIYLKPWRAMASVGVRATMPSHNLVNDVPSHGNRWLLHDSYRRSMGFDGVLLSDCNDVGVLASYEYATNLTHAASIALRAGVDWDLQCHTADYWSYTHLKEALEGGLTSTEDIDEAVRHVLTLKIASGVFDTPYTNPSAERVAGLDSPKYRRLAREAAQQGLVLLKNDGVLPFAVTGDTAPRTIAIIGAVQTDYAAEGAAYVGAYTAGPVPKVTTISMALEAAGFKGKITTARGCEAKGLPDAGAEMIPEAVALAKEADKVIMVVGDVQGGCGEWEDRDSLDLQGGQLALLEAVGAVAKGKVVTVLIHGRPQTFGRGNAVLGNVSALIAAWRPGVEGGSGIVDVITGVVSPSGKLAQSWPRSVGQVQSGSSPWMQRVNGKWVMKHVGEADPDGRRYYGYSYDGWKSTPLFHFGFGLSYTTFQYSKLQLTNQLGTATALRWGSCNPSVPVITARVTLTNNGTRPGTEVVQVYVEDPTGLPFARYWRRLAGFSRVHLLPSETKTVEIAVEWNDLAMHDGDMTLRIIPGTYTISVGGSGDDTPLTAPVTF